MNNKRLLLVGNPEPWHVGAHFHSAALGLGIPTHFCDVREAFDGSALTRRLNWWLRGHRPSNLRQFGDSVVNLCRNFRPTHLLTTGLTPLGEDSILAIGTLNVKRINFLTDDPWNPAHHAPWFLRTMRHYDAVYSPRHSNIDCLLGCGCCKVTYLPFAHCPQVHYPDQLASSSDGESFDADILFAGGADRDRFPIMKALIRAGFRLTLYGSYWERDKETRQYTRGQADPFTMRKAVAGSRIALCLVRRANRDGHVMRTFEIPAMGGCMLTEDTEEHRNIFGQEGEAVLYFSSIPEMIGKARWLLEHEAERLRLAKAAQDLIVNGRNTYQDRLAAMLA